jgi:hypothetical protein
MSAALGQDVEEIIRKAEVARSAVEAADWGLAERTLTEAQERIGRLLREIGDKQREVLMVPKPDRGDRG